VQRFPKEGGGAIVFSPAALTLLGRFVCICAVRPLLLFSAAIACASCTTLENRRDLYRSPAERYERWHRHPPPTRKPAGPPTPGTPAGATQNHGVITFPEESALPEGQ
jgi:hypothetical protein